MAPHPNMSRLLNKRFSQTRKGMIMPLEGSFLITVPMNNRTATERLLIAVTDWAQGLTTHSPILTHWPGELRIEGTFGPNVSISSRGAELRRLAQKCCDALPSLTNMIFRGWIAYETREHDFTFQAFEEVPA